MDLEKAAQILLLDYRSGALGRISLETPDTRSQMLADALANGPAPVNPDLGADEVEDENENEK